MSLNATTRLLGLHLSVSPLSIKLKRTVALILAQVCIATRQRQVGLHAGVCLIMVFNITIRHKQPTVQFDPLAFSICVDFACFYVEFAFRHNAKKSWKSKLKKKLTSCKYFLLKLQENLVQARPRVVVTSNSGICQFEFPLNRGWSWS